MKFHLLKALSSVIDNVHRILDQTSRWHSVLSLAVTGSQHIGKSLSTSKLIIMLF